MESFFEFFYEVIIDSSLELWTNLMRRRNPNYDSNRYKKMLTEIIFVALGLVLFIVIVGFIAIIEWLFPNFLDIVRFD